MRAKSAILLVMALGCGLVAAIAIKQVMGNRTTVTAVVETAPIYVALETIPSGELIPVEMLKLEEWPKDKIPPGSLSTIEDIKERRTRQTIFKGSPLLDEQLFGMGERNDDIGMTIPKGFRVVTVKVDDVSGSASLIKPHDRVDVLVHLQRNPTKGIDKTSTQTFLQDIKVFAVGSVTNNDNDADPSTLRAKTVSLLVTPKQAELVMLASELGKIRLIMRGSIDPDIAEVDSGADPDDLFGGTSGSEDRLKVPEPVQQVVEESKSTEPPAPPDTWVIKLIEGSAVKDVVLRLPHETRNGDQPDNETGLSLWQTDSPPTNVGHGGNPMQHKIRSPSSPADLLKSEMEGMPGGLLDEKISSAMEEASSAKKSIQAEGSGGESVNAKAMEALKAFKPAE